MGTMNQMVTGIVQNVVKIWDQIIQDNYVGKTDVIIGEHKLNKLNLYKILLFN